jgi:ribonucleoside-diphosphate reductase alpha chain
VVRHAEAHYGKKQQAESADEVSSGGNGSSAESKPANVPVAAGATRAPEDVTQDGAAEAAARAWETARLQGYEGDPCPVCGHSTLVRNGTCLKCLTCGSTTGCS